MPSENTSIKMWLTQIGSCETENNLPSISVERIEKTNNIFINVAFDLISGYSCPC